MSNFTTAYDLTTAHEGGWSCNPADRGGETYKGIARKLHPGWKGWPIVDLLKEPGDSATDITETLAEDGELQMLVIDFYKEHFWDVLNLSKIAHQEVANEVFDTAVNQGAPTAGKYLQQALNLLNQNGKLHKDIVVDGNIGPVTLAAYDSIVVQLKSRYGIDRVVSVMLKALNGLQFERYRAICANDPTQEVFFFGWINNRIN